MIGKDLSQGYVPALNIEKQTEIPAGERHAAVDVAQHRYYFPWQPCAKGTQSAFFPAVRDDGTHWALIVRRLKPKTAELPAGQAPRIPEPLALEKLEHFAQEMHMLQHIPNIPDNERPTVLFTNASGTKAYGIFALGGMPMSKFATDKRWSALRSAMMSGYACDPARYSHLPADQAAQEVQHMLALDPLQRHEHLSQAEKFAIHRQAMRVIAAQFIGEMYAALLPLHKEAFALHDLKPDNMVRRLGPPLEVKLPVPTPSGGPARIVRMHSYFMPIDYGHATRMGADAAKDSRPGTCPYEAPEQIAHRSTGLASDFWTVGAILLHQMISTELPNANAEQNDLPYLSNPFLVPRTSESNDEWKAARIDVCNAYKAWYRGESYDDGSEGETFDEIHERLGLIDESLRDLIFGLMNPSVAARAKLTLPATLGAWLATHADEVRLANKFMAPLLQMKPTRATEICDALDAIDANKRTALDKQFAPTHKKKA